MQRQLAIACGVLIALVLAAAPAVHTQAPAANPRVDAIFKTWDRADSPGCAIGAIQNGRFVYTRGYGMANLDYGLKNSPTMVYYVGSVSKQFTAASVALLAAEGRIGLDDPVRKYIPELREYGAPLTVRHLVHHTSGIRDIYTLMSLGGIRMEDVFPDDDALGLIARQKELNFPPGSDYLYSNSGYWLLGQIVERVTGESLREYARKKLFEPLGMTHTHFHDDPGHVMADRVVSYARTGTAEYRIADLGNFDKIGAGGLYTTVEDLLKWDANFYEPKVGGPEWLKVMQTPGTLTTGGPMNYAFGLTIGTHRGLRTVRHGGSLMGFRAELLRYPDQRFTAIVLCNFGSIAPAGLAERMAEVFIGDRMQPAPATQAAAAGAGSPAGARGRGAAPGPPPVLDRAALAAYEGTYRSEEVQADYTIKVAAGALVLERRLSAPATLQAVATDEFRAGNLTLKFNRDAGGRTSAFTVEAGRVRNIRFDRVR